MATLIPAIGGVLAQMTSGERRFAERLESHLEDDYLCWYDVPVGEQGLHPDFVVLHPRRGLLILEVKDWRLDTIQRISRQAATIMTNNGLKQVTSPMEQARRYAHAVVQQLESDHQLTFPSKHRYAGRLMVPWGYGVVLANITRRQFEQQSDLGLVFPPGRVICQDEMTASVDSEDFQSRLWGMFRHVPESPLSLPQIDRIRWHMFPEVRIQQGSLFDSAGETPSTGHSVTEALPDLLRVMDLKQEQLARSLGSGHRIIHGAAGAGKTLILVYRCVHLAKVLRKPILVLCYNKTLAERLQSMMNERGLGGSVQVRNFHKWCYDQCKAYHVALPPKGQGPEFSKALVERTVEAAGKGTIPPAQYGAVMIDEGHDFEPHWLSLAVQMVDPQTDSVLVLYDDAQSIYSRSRGKFTFSSVGIQARGRTTILRINYRNSEEIIQLATGFAREILDPKDAEEDGIPLVAPTSAGRHGPPPQLIRLPNLTREAEHIATDFLRFHHQDRYAWDEMAIICRARFIADTVEKALKRSGIPVNTQWRSAAGKAENEGVRLLTMHSSKGLEFPVVAIPGIGYLPYKNAEESEEARLMYVAMTRALEHLLLTGDRSSKFIMQLEALADTPLTAQSDDTADSQGKVVAR